MRIGHDLGRSALPTESRIQHDRKMIEG